MRGRGREGEKHVRRGVEGGMGEREEGKDKGKKGKGKKGGRKRKMATGSDKVQKMLRKV